MSKVQIQNGQVFTGKGFEQASITVENGKITAVGATTDCENIVDATGLHIIPGVIDTQVHFREPGNEHKEDLATGTLSALIGGITGVFEMPNTNPTTSTQAAIDDKLNRAKNRAWCDYAFYVGATSDNLDNLAALEKTPGTCGIKIFMGSSTGSLLLSSDSEIEQVLKNTTRPIAIHCEDEDRLIERKHIAVKGAHPSFHPQWRDEESSLKATRRLLHLAKKLNRKVHVLHISTKEEMDFLRTQKEFCTVECTPQYLTLHAPDCYEKYGTFAQMNPPIRNRKHQQALWQALQSGIVDVLGSDHAPHTKEEKQKPYPNSPSGLPGVQTLLPLMLNHVNDGNLSLQKLIELISVNPTKLFSLPSRGQIETGYDATFTFLDLKKTDTIKEEWLKSKCGWSPFVDKKITGWPVGVMLRGEKALWEGQLVGDAKGNPFEFANL